MVLLGAIIWTLHTWYASAFDPQDPLANKLLNPIRASSSPDCDHAQQNLRHNSDQWSISTNSFRLFPLFKCTSILRKSSIYEVLKHWHFITLHKHETKTMASEPQWSGILEKDLKCFLGRFLSFFSFFTIFSRRKKIQFIKFSHRTQMWKKSHVWGWFDLQTCNFYSNV